MKRLKGFFKEWLIIGIIIIIVGLLWQGLELLLIGEIRPNIIGSIITYILSISIYINIWFIQKKKSA